MKLTDEQVLQLTAFFNQSHFATHGAIITDLDGTAVHEYNGRTVIHESVEIGLKMMNDLGRPIIINTLRFPLSVIRTFAQDWYKMSNAPIPVILLNGSQLGYIKQQESDKSFYFEQVAAFTLTADDIEEVIKGVQGLIKDGISNLVLFFYPEDWTKGEIIWTPDINNIPAIQSKYLSASSVISSTVDELKATLHSQKVCMIFLLIDVPEDRLMAYQHSKRSNFITRKNVDKLYGSQQMAGLLGFDLDHSIGAGDTPMDSFLGGVGLSVHVGRGDLEFKGTHETIRLRGFHELGDLLFRFANMQLAFIKA
jgi:hydroxymethylpyrimidine pyrophosphatase-like HAD family hydrolase